MAETWKITLVIRRQKQGRQPYDQSFEMEVNPDENVIDAIERVWAFHDRSLTYAHACHHSTCGACGMRVNNVEKLTCITPIRSVVADGGLLRIEPMRNFPVISDLAVDMGELYRRMELVGHRPLNADQDEAIQKEFRPAGPAAADEVFLRLSDCIECGLCMSACPIVGSNADYLGPAPLAGAHQAGLANHPALLALLAGPDGLWRCHSAFECSAVCPSNVDPAWRIMELRRTVVAEKVKSFFNPHKQTEAHA